MKQGKIILYIAMSLDGYIARENGAIDWLSGQGDDQPGDVGYEAFLETIQTVVMGWKTYEQIVTELSPDAWVYPQQEALIVTRKNVELPEGRTCVSVNELVDRVQAEVNAGKNVWLIGGAQTITPFLEAGLIDEYVITIMPTLIGEGIRLFPNRAGEEQKLRLVSEQVVDGMVMLTYHRR